MDDRTAEKKIIPVHKSLITPSEPAARRVRARKLADYPQVPADHRAVAQRLSSPLLWGPPICDELMALVQHLFSEEEAALVRCLRPFGSRTVEQIAQGAHRPAADVAPILERLALEKGAIVQSGPSERPRYGLMPICPGVYEMVLIRSTPAALGDWHRRFAELFEALYETGYLLDYGPTPAPMVRYLPLGRAVDAHPMALPTDKLEIVLDQFTVFGIGPCQCRVSAQALGRGCGKPIQNCTVMGKWAEAGIRQGWLKQASKQEVLDAKLEAEAHGMVNWMMNVAATKGQSSCSCCGCCCHAMRMVSQFNAPGLVAPPHFQPQFDAAKCNGCGRCVRDCPMKALSIEAAATVPSFRVERCIGCGLCALACQRQHAIAMQPVPEYRMPYRSWFSLLLRAAPNLLATTWKVWWNR